VSSPSHDVNAPEVARPPARLRVPGNAPAVVHIEGVRKVCVPVATRNIVVPYINMRSPTSWAPALTASIHALMLPEITRLPTGSPVVRAASGVTVPATSPAHANSGGSTPVAKRCHHVWHHSSASTS